MRQNAFGRSYLWVVVFILMGKGNAEARFASQFSLSTGEQYTDNVFFSENKQDDFITTITPALYLLYQPSPISASKLTVDINAPAEIFARHSDLNNIGNQLSFRSNFYYPYSRRLSFTLTDCLGRLGKARNGSFGDARQGGGSGTGSFGNLGGIGSTGCGGSGGFGGAGSGGSQSLTNEGELVTSGEVLENSFDASGTFLATPNLSLRGAYRWRYIAFFGEGGKETSQGGEFEASYNKWQQHRLYARFRIEFLKSRDGEKNTIFDVDVGDNYFSSRQIQLTPTLTLFAGTGISMATENSKFRLEHKLNVRLVKLWRTAQFEVGVRRGLTGSYGVAGVSYTTSFFSYFTVSLTRRLNAFATADYSMFNTDQENFNTFIAGAGISYNIFYWLSANLAYTYRRANPEGNFSNSNSSLQGNTDSNSVFIVLSAAFDLWPQLGLGRNMGGIQMLPATFPGGASSPSSTTPTP